MEGSKPPLLFVLLLLLLYTLLPVYSISPTPSPSPSKASSPSPTPSKASSPSPIPSKASSPSPLPSSAPKAPFSSPPAPSPSSPATLDSKQLIALHSLNIPTFRDPCLQSSSSPNNSIVCDFSTPFRFLISLHLSNCSDEVHVSSTALRSLSTLRSLSFFNCPLPPLPHLPSALSSNLRSFSAVSSLRSLTGVWLSRLHNLSDLTVTDVPVIASGPAIILSNMRNIKSITISRASLTGFLPRRWRPTITHLDLSANQIRGRVPVSLTRLPDLTFLNLSSNQLSGPLPDTFGELISLRTVSLASNSLSGPITSSLVAIPSLTHLDLSSNQFNGSVPSFLSQMQNLKYLNLENNNLQGAIPFNESTIRRFAVFRVGRNSNLCYNHSLVSSRLKLGIARCAKDGFPVQPTTERTDSSGVNGSDDDLGEEKPKENRRRGPNKAVLGVAIVLSAIVFVIIILVLLLKCCK